MCPYRQPELTGGLLLSAERVELYGRVSSPHDPQLARRLTRFSCHQQMWDCFPNSMIDYLFEGTTGFYYSWSTVCQEVLTFSPTTMIITKPPAYDQEDCLSYALDCDSLTVAMTSCNSAYNTPGTDLNGCLCNEDMLYWGSRCDIDANQSCLRKTLDPTAVYSNQYCGRTAQSGPASRTSPASSSTVSRLEPTSSYVPPAPSSVAGAGAAATSGPTGSGVARQAVDRSSATAAFALVVAVFFA